MSDTVSINRSSVSLLVTPASRSIDSLYSWYVVSDFHAISARFRM